MLFQGMHVRQFQAIPSIVELVCSGLSLPVDADLLSIVLYEKTPPAVLASLNLKTRECSTSNIFSSCVIDEKNSHLSKISILILGVASHETQEFGCDVTTYKPGDRPKIVSWSFNVTRTRVYFA